MYDLKERMHSLFMTFTNVENIIECEGLEFEPAFRNSVVFLNIHVIHIQSEHCVLCPDAQIPNGELLIEKT